VANGEADIGIATESISSYDSLLCLPCYHWNRCVVVPHGHPLLTGGTLTLEKLHLIRLLLMTLHLPAAPWYPRHSAMQD